MFIAAKLGTCFLIEAQSPQKRTEAREVTRTQTSGCAEESIWRWVVTTGILCKRTHNLVLFVDSLWLYLAAPVFKQWHNLTLTGCKYKFNCIKETLLNIGLLLMKKKFSDANGVKYGVDIKRTLNGKGSTKTNLAGIDKQVDPTELNETLILAR